MWKWATILFILNSSCVSSGHGGSEGSSEAINQQEVIEYQKSLLRCHKTGGSRVVKIAGTIRCF